MMTCFPSSTDVLKSSKNSNSTSTETFLRSQGKFLAGPNARPGFDCQGLFAAVERWMDRVNVLGKHICGKNEDKAGSFPVMNQTSGGSEERPPAGREGKLTILDQRTNKRYEVGGGDSGG